MRGLPDGFSLPVDSCARRRRLYAGGRARGRLWVAASPHAPMAAAHTEAASTAIRASVYCSSSWKASPAIKIDTVKPIPPNHETACSWLQFTPRGNSAKFRRTAIQENSVIPSGFPSINPSTTPRKSGCSTAFRSRPSSEIPAFTRANSGTIPKLTHGCSPRSRRPAGD